MKPNASAKSRRKSARTVLATAAVTLSLSAASAEDSHASKHYVLPASTENVQWGWYDIN